MQHAHEHGLVHRDIKPPNLMLTAKGDVKLLDLGLALLDAEEDAPRDLTHTGNIMGTVDYISPEQIRDTHNVDIRTDLYSLGCTLFKLLTGRAPFEEPRFQKMFDKLMAHTNEPPPSLESLRSDVTAELSAVVSRLLAKNPEERYQTPAELAEALAPFAVGHRLSLLGSDLESTDPVMKSQAATATLISDNPAETSRTEQPQPTVIGNLTPPPPKSKVGLMLGGFFAAIVLLGIIIKITTPDGTVTQVEVPDGSTSKVDDDGNVEVNLPETSDDKTVQNAPIGDREFFTQLKDLGAEVVCYFDEKYINNPERVLSALTPEGTVYRLTNIDQLGTKPDLLKAPLVFISLEGDNLSKYHLERLSEILRSRPIDASPISLRILSPSLLASNLKSLEGVVFDDLVLLRIEFDERSISQIGHLQKVSSLAVSRVSMSDKMLNQLTSFENLSDLWSLSVNRNPITDEGLSALSQLKKLQVVHLRATKVTEAGVQKLHEQMPQLQIIWDGGTIEPSEKPTARENDERPPWVEIDNEPIGDREFFTKLKELGASVAYFESWIDEFPNATEILSASEQHSGGFGSAYFLQQPEMLDDIARLLTKPLVLGFPEGTLPDGKLKTVSDLLRRRPQNSNPLSINISTSRVKATEFSLLQGLEFATFGTDNVTYDIESIAFLRELDIGYKLVLYYAKINDEILEKLTTYPNLQSLKRLYLKRNSITDDSIQSLTRFTQLEAVYLEYTEVTEAGVKKLHKQMPQLTIHWDGGTIEPSEKPPASEMDNLPLSMLEDEQPAKYVWPNDQPAPAIVPFTAEEAQQHQQEWASHLGTEVEITNSIGMKLRLVPPGEFWMKDVETRDQEEWNNSQYGDAELCENVVIPQPYWMGTYEVTRGQFRQFVEETGYEPTSESRGGAGWKDERWVLAESFTWDANPGYEIAPTDEHPAVNVSPRDAIAFCHWLNDKEGVVYRLPTEAEWAFACRAGSTAAYHFGNDVAELPKYAWINKEGGRSTHRVGEKLPNAFGLHDLHGNAWEASLSSRTLSDGRDRIRSPRNSLYYFRYKGGDFWNHPSLAKIEFWGYKGKHWETQGHYGFRIIRTNEKVDPTRSWYDSIGDREFFTRVMDLGARVVFYHNPQYLKEPETVLAASEKAGNAYALKKPELLGEQTDFVKAPLIFIQMEGSDLDIDVIERLSQLLKLRPIDASHISVHLTSGKLPASCLRYLAEIPLDGFGITYTKFSIEDLLVFASFLSIDSLGLNTAGITDQHLDKLSTFDNLQDLRTFVLDNNPLTDAGLERLVQFQKLIRIHVRNTKVTEQGVQKLHEQMPQLKIIWDGGVIEPSEKPAESSEDDTPLEMEAMNQDGPLVAPRPK